MNHLIQQLQATQTQLKAVIDEFPESKREETLFDKWSLKDVLAHINHWYMHDLNCLRDLKKGKEPYWAPDVNEYNQEGIESRKNKSWDEIYNEFVSLGSGLVEQYESLPSDLWEIRFWKNRKFTPKKFIKIDIEHLGPEHLPEIQKRYKNRF